MIKITTVDIARELERRKYNQIECFFPDKGKCRRELYPKHLEFFKAGAQFREKIFIAANRVGKTIAGGYEVACHLTGIYPDWWEGKRFDKPIVCWCAGDTGKTTRDIIQLKLLGMPGAFGTGLIPKDKIIRTLAKQGISDGIEMIHVKHISGGNSLCVLKSYDQRREGFQGTEVHVIWPDEEPPMDIYVEMLLRTMTTNGIVLTTFTPLMGLSDVVLSFCPGGELVEGTVKDNQTKHVTVCDWDSVPHLSQKDKDDMYAAIPPFQRDARSKGVPQLGSGAIYQVPESEIIIDDRDIPKHWKRSFGMDVGWNRTAAVWSATDPETGVVYLYHEYYRGHAEPAVHAQGIKAPGDWIPGAIDPAARGRGQSDGHSLADIYNDLGLHLTYANNAVEAGIYQVWEMLSSGRLKVFKSLTNWRAEYRVYRRDEKGKIVKENDHLMDACLHGDTLVSTINGTYKIKDLVGTSGFVYGIDGKLTAYKHCRMTKRKAATIKLTLSNGEEIICTPDHRFMTNKGWIEARYLMDATRYDNISICKLKSSPTNNKNFKGASIGCAANTINVMELGFIEKFGRLSITKKFLKDFISITSMAIGLIMSRIISSLNLIKSMYLSIKKDIKEKYPHKRYSLLQNGMGVKRESCGILSMVKNVQKRLFQKISNVKNVENIIKPKIQEKIDSAILIVKQELSESVDVYCMEVPKGNAFILANGMISHNCRYNIMTGLSIAKVKPVINDTQQFFGGQNLTTGWMG